LGVAGGLVALEIGLATLGLLAPSGVAEPAADARDEYRQAEAKYRDQPKDAQAAWQYGRACFDLAEVATNNTERAEVAEQGIAACRELVGRDPQSAQGHYYLALNLGELARTRGLGALKLVGEMEPELKTARGLDPKLDYAGADRALGLLYRDAPSLISVGSRSKARRHLEQAVQLAPGFPENNLILIESYLEWNDRKAALGAFNRLEQRLPAARAKFTGPAWAASWADWDARIQKLQKKLEQTPRLQTPRH